LRCFYDFDDFEFSDSVLRFQISGLLPRWSRPKSSLAVNPAEDTAGWKACYRLLSRNGTAFQSLCDRVAILRLMTSSLNDINVLKKKIMIIK